MKTSKKTSLKLDPKNLRNLNQKDLRRIIGGGIIISPRNG